jgi:hypothetical protein
MPSKETQVDIPIRIRLKILDSVIKPIAFYACEVWGPLANQEFTKWDKHKIEILHSEYMYVHVQYSVQRQTPNKCMQSRIRLIPANYQHSEKRRLFSLLKCLTCECNVYCTLLYCSHVNMFSMPIKPLQLKLN